MPEPLKIDFNSFFPPSMTLHGINSHLHSPPTTPGHQQNGHSPAPSSRLSLHGTIDHGTPTRPSKSTPASGTLSPLQPETESPRIIQSRHLSNSDPPAESPDPWSSAVGRATTGKSGRVIERLMGEKDKMARDLKLSTAKLEEEARRGESTRVALDSLRTTNENLKAIHDSDKAAVSRRDRKIEELKADLDAERSRREQAEMMARDAVHERDETVNRYRREALDQGELARKATSQYDALLRSWKGLEDGCKRQADGLTSAIAALRKDREADLKTITQRDVLIEQLQQGVEKVKQAKDEMEMQFEEYRAEKEEGLKEIKEKAESNEKANEKALEELTKVMGEMKYIINVTKNLKGGG